MNESCQSHWEYINKNVNQSNKLQRPSGWYVRRRFWLHWVNLLQSLVSLHQLWGWWILGVSWAFSSWNSVVWKNCFSSGVLCSLAHLDAGSSFNPLQIIEALTVSELLCFRSWECLVYCFWVCLFLFNLFQSFILWVANWKSAQVYNMLYSMV